MPSRDILVGATFSAEPLAHQLQAHGAEQVSFVQPSALLSFLSQAAPINPDLTLILLIRLEDLIRDEKGTAGELAHSLRRQGPIWLDAITTYCAQLPRRPYLVVVPSPACTRQGGQLAATCNALARKLRALPCVHLLKWSAFIATTGDLRLFDSMADRLGHVPITLEGFAALGAWLMQQKRTSIAGPAPAPHPVTTLRPDAESRFYRYLNLQIRCTEMKEIAHFEAASRLSHQAHCHLSGRGHATSTLARRLAEGGLTGLLIDASDRFGRYPQCGFILIRHGAEPCISEWVLQTAVLGKQIEHCLLYALAATARQAGLESLSLSYVDHGANREMISLIDALYAMSGGLRCDVGSGMRLIGMPPTAWMDALLAQSMAPDVLVGMALPISRDWLCAKPQGMSALLGVR
ncbi:hypothetical protein HNQ59_001902 [Chitinivorax tropicus]|uniref:Uncharacterized protein n=1 Tax=Chitinivorax tropicus TaxID=714531 RepID=A0A840MTT8_9PROT|nr:hypothetical protein [Chitinivorax tropicus]MBB5018611.1 hypothetical protein [Chitinivorax tropicus]